MSDVDEHIYFLRGLFDETSESGERCNEIADILSRLRIDLAQRTAQRDEARRMACEYEARYEEERSYPLDPPDEGNIQRDMRRISAERGWDCFQGEVQP